MDDALSGRTASAATGRKSSSRVKSGVSERREKTAMEAWSDGGDCDAEEVRKEQAPPAALQKKGVRSEKKFKL